MNTVKILLKRDLGKQIGKKVIIVYGILGLFGIYFFFCSNGYNLLLQGNLDYMSIMMPQIFFGAWASLTVFYDGIAEDRDTHVLDCILCSGVQKKQIYISKVISYIMISMLCSVIYLLPLMAAIIIKTQGVKWVPDIAEYIIPIWAYVMIYAAIGTLVSVLARSAKKSLIICLALGLILMPRFYMLIIDGICGLLHLGDVVNKVLGMISPGVLIYDLADLSNRASVLKGMSFFIICIIIFSIITYQVFKNQDELSY